MSKLPVSFEFFPPKTPEGAEKLRAVRQQLYSQAPEFCSGVQTVLFRSGCGAVFKARWQVADVGEAAV